MSYIIHCGIVAYLTFILFIGCGYKDNPFYKESTNEAKTEIVEDATNEADHTHTKKKVLFHGVDAVPTLENEE